MASQLGHTADGAARPLLAWVHAGCRPSVDDLLELDATGVPSVRTVSGPALRRLRHEAGGAADARDDAELAMLLAAVGTVTDDVAGLRTTAASGAEWRGVLSGG